MAYRLCSGSLKQPVTVRWIDANQNPDFIGPLPQSVLTDAQKRGSLSDLEVFIQLLQQPAPGQE